ncbi:MAG: hypothetical protein R2873_08245 [Caldilineaceae bacterium]
MVIGSFAAELFVPLFRVSGDGPMPLPPLLPVVAHDEILPLVFGFAGATLLELVVLSSAPSADLRGAAHGESGEVGTGARPKYADKEREVRA